MKEQCTSFRAYREVRPASRAVACSQLNEQKTGHSAGRGSQKQEFRREAAELLKLV